MVIFPFCVLYYWQLMYVLRFIPSKSQTIMVTCGYSISVHDTYFWMPHCTYTLLYWIQVQRKADFLCPSFFTLVWALYPVNTAQHTHCRAIGDFQGRLIDVLSRPTPTEYKCLGTVQAQKAMYTCIISACKSAIVSLYPLYCN